MNPDQPFKWATAPHGRGKDNVFAFADGSKYTGQFKNGRICGWGKYESVTGESMEGFFEDGVLHGRGRHVDVNGVVRQGTFRHGSLHGDGKETIPGKVAKKKGLNRAGKERLAYPGEVFTGEFVNGERQGLGEIEYDNGDFYEGIFEGGVRQGPGTFRYGNVRFEGETGVELRRYDHKYEGVWLANKIRSKGCHTSRNESSYEGVDAEDSRYYTTNGKSSCWPRLHSLGDVEWRRSRHFRKGIKKCIQGQGLLAKSLHKKHSKKFLKELTVMEADWAEVRTAGAAKLSLEELEAKRKAIRDKQEKEAVQRKLEEERLLQVSLKTALLNEKKFREYEHPANPGDGKANPPYEFLKLTEYAQKLTRTREEMKAERARTRARKRMNARAVRKAERLAAHKIALDHWRRAALEAEMANEDPPRRPPTPEDEAESEEEADDATGSSDEGSSRSSAGMSEAEAAGERAAGEFADEANILSMNYAGKIKMDKVGMENPYAAFRFTSSVYESGGIMEKTARSFEQKGGGKKDDAQKDAAGIAKRDAVGQDNPLGALASDNPFARGAESDKKKRVRVPALGGAGGLFRR